MTDGEILEKYINLDNSCLTESERVQLRDMIYKYKEAFSLRDEIGTCPNIEIDNRRSWTKCHSLSDHIRLEKKTKES